MCAISARDHAAAQDDHRLRERVEPHDRVGGVHAVLVERRPSPSMSGMTARLPAAITIRSARDLGAGRQPQRARSDELGVLAVERGVRSVDPVVAPGHRHRVEPAEDPVPDVGPAHLVDMRVDPEPRALSSVCRASSAAYTNILVGMQPTLLQVPPNVDSSTIPMSRWRRDLSAIELPDPVPMMIRSWCGMRSIVPDPPTRHLLCPDSPGMVHRQVWWSRSQAATSRLGARSRHESTTSSLSSATDTAARRTSTTAYPS